MSHGHLTPSNIFLAPEAKFSDLGLFTIKKIASVHLNYKNKSCYSAPETLAERGIKNNLGSIVKRSTHE